MEKSYERSETITIFIIINHLKSCCLERDKRYSVWIILFCSLMDIVWHWGEPQEETVI